MLAKPLRLQLLAIRTAMLLGVLAFGALTWFLQRDGRTPALAPETLQRMTSGLYLLLAVVLGLLLLLRSRVADAAAGTQRLLYLVGYAAAEAVAIFGGAIWFFGGDRLSYLLGLVLMAVSFQVLPIARD
jgi:hypothetical protein